MAKSLDITLHFETPKELELFINGLNNAIIAYNDIWFSMYMGLEVPLKWDKYTKMEDFAGADILKERLAVLMKYYKQLEENNNGEIF